MSYRGFFLLCNFANACHPLRSIFILLLDVLQCHRPNDSIKPFDNGGHLAKKMETRGGGTKRGQYNLTLRLEITW